MSSIPQEVMHNLAKNTKTNGRVLVTLFRPEDCRPKVERHKAFCLGTEGIVENVSERVSNPNCQGGSPSCLKATHLFEVESSADTIRNAISGERQQGSEMNDLKRLTTTRA